MLHKKLKTKNNRLISKSLMIIHIKRSNKHVGEGATFANTVTDTGGGGDMVTDVHCIILDTKLGIIGVIAHFFLLSIETVHECRSANVVGK